MNKPKKPKETESAKWLAKISKDAMANYEKKYYPLERQHAMDMKNNYASREDRLTDDAGVATEMAFGRDEPQVQLGMANAGVDPSSGRGLSTISGRAQDKGMSKGLGMSDARQGAKNTYYSDLLNTIRTGKQQEAGAIQGAAPVADASNRQAILDSRASAAARDARNQFLGTVGGYGLGYGMDAMKAPSSSPTAPPSQEQASQYNWGSNTPQGGSGGYEETLRRTGMMGPGFVNPLDQMGRP